MSRLANRPVPSANTREATNGGFIQMEHFQLSRNQLLHFQSFVKTNLSVMVSLFKNIVHVGSFNHFIFVYLHICVYVYLCILHLIHRNVIFDILESHAFQK